MSSSLIEAVESRLTPDIVGKVAGSIGESPAKTSSAISATVPAIFAGLMQKGSSESGATGLLSSLKDMAAQQTFGEPTDPKGIMTRGSRLATSMLGDSGGRISDLIAKTTGVRRESSSGIMSFVFPMIAGVIGKQVLSRGLGAAGLSELLMSQKKSIMDHPSLPRGLSGALGLSDLSELGGAGAVVPEPHVSVAQAASRVPGIQREVVSRTVHKRGTPWGAILGALAIGALVVGGLIYFTRGARHAELPRTEAPVAQAPDRPAAPAIPAVPSMPEVEKPNMGMPKTPTSETSLTSGEMKAGADKTAAGGDITSRFGDKSGKLPDRMALPGVNFEFASVKMVEGGQSSVDELAKNMKDHPSARIRLEGYTDSVGGDDVNAPLSYKRAMVVKQMLIEKGVDGTRIETVGRREIEPVADNASDDGRAKNRRTDVVLISR